jgi:hypothetical protein
MALSKDEMIELLTFRLEAIEQFLEDITGAYGGHMENSIESKLDGFDENKKKEFRDKTTSKRPARRGAK